MADPVYWVKHKNAYALSRDVISTLKNYRPNSNLWADFNTLFPYADLYDLMSTVRKIFNGCAHILRLTCNPGIPFGYILDNCGNLVSIRNIYDCGKNMFINYHTFIVKE